MASFIPDCRPHFIDILMMASMLGPMLTKPTEKMPNAKSKLEVSALIVCLLSVLLKQ